MKNPPPWQPGEPVSASKLNAHNDRAITDITASGPGVRLTRQGNRVALLVQSQPAPAAAAIVLVKITGNAALRTSNSITIGGGSATTCTIHWKYAWEEVIEKADGTTETLTGGRTGTTGTNFALNEGETGNLADGTNVGGIDITGDSYPQGFLPQPVPNGTVVRLTRKVDGETTFYAFAAILTTHDGDCEAE
jgi:hypothetical protein